MEAARLDGVAAWRSNARTEQGDWKGKLSPVPIVKISHADMADAVVVLISYTDRCFLLFSDCSEMGKTQFSFFRPMRMSIYERVRVRWEHEELKSNNRGKRKKEGKGRKLKHWGRWYQDDNGTDKGQQPNRRRKNLKWNLLRKKLKPLRKFPPFSCDMNRGCIALTAGLLAAGESFVWVRWAADGLAGDSRVQMKKKEIYFRSKGLV